MAEAFLKYHIAYNNLDSYYVFQGDTALRIFYGSPRISLDMGYTLISRNLEEVIRDFTKIRNIVEKILISENISVGKRSEKIIEDFYRCFLIFNTVRYLRRKIRIKIEVIKRKYRNIVFDRKILDIDYL